MVLCGEGGGSCFYRLPWLHPRAALVFGSGPVRTERRDGHPEPADCLVLHRHRNRHLRQQPLRRALTKTNQKATLNVTPNPEEQQAECKHYKSFFFPFFPDPHEGEPKNSIFVLIPAEDTWFLWGSDSYYNGSFCSGPAALCVFLCVHAYTELHTQI